MTNENGITDVDLPEWPEILRACQAQLASRIHTSLPATVVSYDSTTQTATVQLAVQLQGESVPPLAEVPILWPGGSSGYLHIPLAAGDNVLICFSEEDYSRWFVSGSVSNPSVLARHGLHAIAIPGLWRTPNGATAGHVTLSGTEVRLGTDAASAFVALATLVDARLSAMVTYINTHVHATAALGPPVPPTVLLGVQASVAATKVKAT